MENNQGSPDVVPASSPFLVPRRHFLLAGSAAVVGAAATGLPQQVIRVLKGSDPAALPVLSVGYWNGLIRRAASDEAKAALAHKVVSAARVAPSAELSRGASVCVVGLWRAEAHRQKPVSIDLKTIYPAVDPKTGEKLAFHAWSHTTAKNVRSHAGRVQFDVPVDGGNPLQLAVEMTRPAAQESFLTRRVKEMLSMTEAADPVTKNGGCALALNRRSSSLQLSRGVYFLALQESEHDKAPDWASVRMLDPQAPGALDADGKGLLYEASLTGPRPVSFSYLVISVDQA